MPHENEQYDSLPPAIIDALRDLDGPAVMPDPLRDADVLSGVRQHLTSTARVERKRRNLRLFFAGGAGGAIAAAVAVAFVVFFGNPQHEPIADQPASIAMNNEEAGPAEGGDLDANGTVDILDAYLLAKRVEANEHFKAYDYNADGRIDQLDIDWLANQAVALNTGERG